MTIKQKQLILCWFECLGSMSVDGIWGPQSAEATKKLQEKLGIEANGIFGQTTREAALNAMTNGWSPDKATGSGDFWDEIEYFTPGEFACKCGRHCDGYPHKIQPLLVQIAERARKHFGQPITIVSGLRCETHNANVGGVWNSQHMYGEAADVYVRGVSQQTALNWFLSQPEVRYAYAIEGSSNVHFDIQPVGR